MNNCVLIKITGKNVNNYLKWLITNKITIIHLNSIKHNEMKIVVNYQDYQKLLKYSKTYKIIIIKKYGKLKLYDVIKNNYINILCLIISIVFLYIVSHIIFSIDIMYHDNDIIEIINKELKKYDIQKFHFKKNTNYLNKVKQKILLDNKDIIEWLEIEENGTKYIVRLVERKEANKTIEYKYQSIVAKKDAIIKSIDAYSGEKVKQVNEYVKRNDTIISGILTKPDNTKIYVKAKGRVIADTWYKATVEYPLYYQEEKLTGKSKNVITIYFLNYELSIFPYKKYKNFHRRSHIIFENNTVPIKIVSEKLYEVSVKERIYTYEEAIEKAKIATQEKIKLKNNLIVNITDIKVLNKEHLNSKIKLDFFISAIEDITKLMEVIPDAIEEKVEN